MIWLSRRHAGRATGQSIANRASEDLKYRKTSLPQPTSMQKWLRRLREMRILKVVSPDVSELNKVRQKDTQYPEPKCSPRGQMDFQNQSFSYRSSRPPWSSRELVTGNCESATLAAGFCIMKANKSLISDSDRSSSNPCGIADT